MITYDNWPEDWSQVPEMTEIAEDVYEYFLNVLPPLCWHGSYFQGSEPYSHDKNGKPKFMTFSKINGKCYYIGIHNYGGNPN